MTNLEYYKKDILDIITTGQQRCYNKGKQLYTFSEAVEKCMGEKLPDYTLSDFWIYIINWLVKEHE